MCKVLDVTTGRAAKVMKEDMIKIEEDSYHFRQKAIQIKY